MKPRKAKLCAPAALLQDDVCDLAEEPWSMDEIRESRGIHCSETLVSEDSPANTVDGRNFA